MGAQEGHAGDMDEATRAAMLVTAQKNRAKEEAAAAKQEKALAEKAKKDAYKQSAHGKAQVWLKGCTSKLTDIATLVTQCSEATKVDPATSQLYKDKFDTHRRKLKQLRDGIEEALQGCEALDEAKTQSVGVTLANANKTVESFKEDRQAWSVIHRLANKKSS